MLTIDETRQLDRLAFTLAGSPSPDASGSRVARARGAGSEFHDTRPYHAGDDPRAIDWSVYARFDQLVVRTYRAAAQTRVHLLLDVSASMAAGRPDKLSCARRVAALLAYIAIRERDAVGLTTFDRRIRTSVAPASGRPQLMRLMGALQADAAAGRSALNASLDDFASAAHGRGLAVILSDFFDPTGVREGLHHLIHRGLTPALIQVLAPEELAPDIDGETDLIDAEDPDAPAVTVTPAAVHAYLGRLSDLVADLGEFCTSRGLAWVSLSSAGSFGDILQACRRGGLLAERM